MVNTTSSRIDELRLLGSAIRMYAVIVVATIGILAVLSVIAPNQTSSDAWVHAVIVAGFAVLLPMRLRAARHGSVSALRAVGLIASALLLVNVVEALIPGFVPVWMRLEMVAIAGLMAFVILLVVRERV